MCAVGIAIANPHTDHDSGAVLLTVLWMGRQCVHTGGGNSSLALVCLT